MLSLSSELNKKVSFALMDDNYAVEYPFDFVDYLKGHKGHHFVIIGFRRRDVGGRGQGEPVLGTEPHQHQQPDGLVGLEFEFERLGFEQLGFERLEAAAGRVRRVG